MKITFVKDSSVNEVWQNNLDKLLNKDLVVFGNNGLGLISYKKELNGETEYFQDIARFSKEVNSAVICGCDTDTYGVFRHSVVVAERGKLLGVIDQAHVIDESEFVPGGNFRVFDFDKCKVGIIVGEDLFFPETARVLTLCDADLLICIFKNVTNSMPQIMLRSMCFSNGICGGLLAENCVFTSDIKGEITLFSRNGIVDKDIKIEKDYHLIKSRRRGLYRDFEGGY